MHFISVLLVFCTEFAAVAGIPEKTEIKQIAEGVVSYQCGACHNPMNKSADPKALDVFDLSLDHWPLNLSPRRQVEFLSRLESRIGLSDLEVSYLMPKKWLPLPARPTKNQIDMVRLYFDQVQRNVDFLSQSN